MFLSLRGLAWARQAPSLLCFNRLSHKEDRPVSIVPHFYCLHLLTHDTREAHFTFSSDGREPLEAVCGRVWSVQVYGSFTGMVVAIVTGLHHVQETSGHIWAMPDLRLNSEI